MKKRYYLILAFILSVGYGQGNNICLYKNAEADIETCVADLVSEMTLKEKVKQLDMHSPNDLVVDGRLSIDKTNQVLNNMSTRAVNYYYPESAEVSNELQKYVIENTCLEIPVLFIDKGLHRYSGNRKMAKHLSS